MGLKQWIYRKFLAPKSVSKSDVEKQIDEFNKASKESYARVIRNADKILEGKLYGMKSREVEERLKSLDEENEEEIPMEEKLLSSIVGNLFAPKPQNNNPPQETQGFQDPLIPPVIAQSLPQDPQQLMALADELGLKDKQIKILKDKGYI